jgi:hypothetical protein
MYEERLNPGLREEWRCTVLTDMIREHDKLLDQAERFSLDRKEALAIWGRRLGELTNRLGRCPDYVPPPVPDAAEAGGYDGADGVPCAHAREWLCAKALPVCAGVCERFRPLAEVEKT